MTRVEVGRAIQSSLLFIVLFFIEEQLVDFAVNVMNITGMWHVVPTAFLNWVDFVLKAIVVYLASVFYFGKAQAGFVHGILLGTFLVVFEECAWTLAGALHYVIDLTLGNYPIFFWPDFVDALTGAFFVYSITGILGYYGDSVFKVLR